MDVELQASSRRRARVSAPVRAIVVGLVASLVVFACGGGSPTLAPALSPDPSADATASVAPATPTPVPTRKPATRVPPRPTNITFKKIEETVTDTSTGDGFVKVKVTWDSPADAATEFKIWGLNRCVNESKKTNKKACLVAGQTLKKTDLTLIETFKGSARSGTIQVPLQGEVTSNVLFETSEFYGLVLGAYNEKGESVLAIITTSDVCWQCTY